MIKLESLPGLGIIISTIRQPVEGANNRLLGLSISIPIHEVILVTEKAHLASAKWHCRQLVLIILLKRGNESIDQVRLLVGRQRFDIWKIRSVGCDAVGRMRRTDRQRHRRSGGQLAKKSEMDSQTDLSRRCALDK